LLGKLHDAVARRDGVMGETTIERLLGHARMATIQLPVDDPDRTMRRPQQGQRTGR